MDSVECVFERLFKRDTVNSFVRRIYGREKHKDSLDLVLSSVYNHEKDLFVSKFDTLLQLENAKYNTVKEKLYDEKMKAQKNNIHHPLVIGKCIYLFFAVYMFEFFLNKRWNHRKKITTQRKIGMHRPAYPNHKSRIF